MVEGRRILCGQDQAKSGSDQYCNNIVMWEPIQGSNTDGPQSYVKESKQVEARTKLWTGVECFVKESKLSRSTDYIKRIESTNGRSFLEKSVQYSLSVHNILVKESAGAETRTILWTYRRQETMW